MLSRPEAAETDEERRFVEVLREKKFLVEDGFDETAQLAGLNRRHRFGGDLLSLSLAPTLACNFRCDYCFEKPSTARMNEETGERPARLRGPADARDGDRLGHLVRGRAHALSRDDRAGAGRRTAGPRRPARLETPRRWDRHERLAPRPRGRGASQGRGRRERPGHARRLEGGPTTPDGSSPTGGARSTAWSVLTVADVLSLGVRVNVDNRNSDSAAGVIAELRRLGLLPFFFFSGGRRRIALRRRSGEGNRLCRAAADK